MYSIAGELPTKKHPRRVLFGIVLFSSWRSEVSLIFGTQGGVSRGAKRLLR